MVLSYLRSHSYGSTTHRCHDHLADNFATSREFLMGSSFIYRERMTIRMAVTHLVCKARCSSVKADLGVPMVKIRPRISMQGLSHEYREP